jgi:hypothetical protein
VSQCRCTAIIRVFLVREAVSVLRNRDVVHEDHRTAIAGRGEPRQVEREAIADIDASVQLVTLVQRNRFAHAGREVEQVTQDTAAKRASHQQPIAGLTTRPRKWPSVCKLANGGYAQHERTIVRVGIATGDCYVEIFSQRQQSFRESYGQLQGVERAIAITWKDQRNHCGERPRGHRGQVAQVHAQRLPADASRIVLAKYKIDAVREAIGRHDDVSLSGKRNERRIVGEPEPRTRMRWYMLPQPAYELELHAPTVAATLRGCYMAQRRGVDCEPELALLATLRCP